MLKNIKKLLVVAGLVSTFFVNTAYASVPVQTVAQTQALQGAWEQQTDATWKYRLDGVYVVTTWVESITESGAWYFLNESGIMATNTYTPDGFYVDAQGIYRAGQTVYTEEDAEQKTEQKTEHKEVEKETYEDPSIDEGLELINEAIANGERVATGNYGLH